MMTTDQAIVADMVRTFLEIPDGTPEDDFSDVGPERATFTADYLTFIRKGDAITVTHEDGRKLGTIDATTGQTKDARRSEDVGSWISGVGLTIAGVIDVLHRDPSDPDTPIPGHDTDEDQERCPSCGDTLTASGPVVCAACAECGVCTVCAGPHYAYRCPEIAAARRADAPNAGRAIWQHSHRRAPHFYDTLRRLDMSIWQVLARACASYEGVPTEAVLDRWLLGVQGTNIPAKAAA